MSEIGAEELKLLAAMVFGESSSKNDFKEMAGIASVLLRQRNARGYTKMQDFVRSEPTYSFVVSDGNARYETLMSTGEAAVESEVADVQRQLTENAEKMKIITSEISLTTNVQKLKAKNTELGKLKKTEKSLIKKLQIKQSRKAAFTAARHAASGGEDYSNGAFFWDGADIKSNYEKHFKVKNGIKITLPEHNIYEINDSFKLVIVKKIIIKKDPGGIKTKTEQEKGRYDHVYESTAAHGGTIFWRHSKVYMDVTGSKEYK